MSVMRRKDKEFTEKVIIEEIFRENSVGRLGTAAEGNPYVVPMNFAYISDKIYLHTHKEGKKIRDIQKNPRVCFEVDAGEIITGEKPCGFSGKYKSAIACARAKAEIVESREERIKALKLISDKYAFGKSKLITPDLVEKFSQLWIIRIDIDQMTGKQSPVKQLQ